jgi:hypothetical protein
MIEINWYILFCIFLFGITIGLQIPKTYTKTVNAIEPKTTVSHDPIINETVYYNRDLGMDSHAAYNKDTGDYIFVVSGVYTIEKEFSAGDKISRPISVRKN